MRTQYSVLRTAYWSWFLDADKSRLGVVIGVNVFPSASFHPDLPLTSYEALTLPSFVIFLSYYYSFSYFRTLFGRSEAFEQGDKLPPSHVFRIPMLVSHHPWRFVQPSVNRTLACLPCFNSTSSIYTGPRSTLIIQTIQHFVLSYALDFLCFDTRRRTALSINTMVEHSM